MLYIHYSDIVVLISAVWLLVRVIQIVKKRRISLKRELQLLLVYVCLIVVARFTFFPFSTVNGQIQPLVFDLATAFPFRINCLPFVYLLDYPNKRDILLNVIGNTTMFLPLGIVWPIVFKELNTPKKAIVAGIGVSLCIEILQLPFYDRVTDIDDLILNTVGFLIGYLIFFVIHHVRRK